MSKYQIRSVCKHYGSNNFDSGWIVDCIGDYWNALDKLAGIFSVNKSARAGDYVISKDPVHSRIPFTNIVLTDIFPVKDTFTHETFDNLVRIHKDMVVSILRE